MADAHRGPRPRRETVDLVFEVWSARRSGHFDGPAGVVTMVEGDPVDAAAADLLDASLVEPGLRFVEKPTEGARFPYAPRLLEAGRHLAHVDSVRRGLDSPVAPGPLADALPRLPLRPAVRRVLRQALDLSEPLGRVIDDSHVDLEQVVGDVAALVALGVIRLSGHSSRRLQGGLRSGGGGLSVDQRQEILRRRLQSRLERDWQALRHADDHAVLGVPRDASPDLLLRAAARMRGRYASVAEDADSGGGAAVRMFLQQLRGRVEQAISNLQVPEGGSSSTSDLLPGPWHAFQLGREAAARGDLGQARRWLGIAHQQDPGAPGPLAWFGWAIVVDPRVSSARARARGVALIDEALALDRSSAVALERGVEAALHLCDISRARDLVERLREQRPDHIRLAMLLRRIDRM